MLTGLVAPDKAFNGFAHPAVITVAAVLVISRGLQNAGIVDVVVKLIAPLRGRENLQIAAQCSAAALLSSFMNNVGALGLIMPVALRNAYRDNYPPAKSLMPLAFASLLGGMTTLIGTPPNLIVSSFRAQQSDGGFGIFDFAPVGVAVAAGGLLFLVTLGWRLLPLKDRKSGEESAFNIEGYVAESDVPAKAKAVGLTIADVEKLANDEIAVVGLIRDKRWRLVPAGHVRIQAENILVLRGDTDGLKTAIDEAGLKLAADREIHRGYLRSDDIDILEAVVNPDSRIVGRTPISMRLRTVYGVNLLAIAAPARLSGRSVAAVTLL